MTRTNLTESDIHFMEYWYTPVCLIECLFHDFDNLTAYKSGRFGEVRLYQYPMVSDESLIDFELTAEYHGMNKKEEFQMRKNVGDIYCFGARKFGKSLMVETMDLIVSMLTSDGDKVAFASVDLIHIKQILDPIKNALGNHRILSHFVQRIKGSPDYYFELKNNYVLNSVNFNLGSTMPGRQWYGKHVKRVYIEEACFSGRARVACIDSKGKRVTKRLSQLVNQNEWRDLKVCSYNLKTRELEAKRIIKPFKKTVKNYTYYKISVFSHDKNTKRVLESSRRQQFWTDQGYKYVTDLKAGDIVYSLDYQQLNRIPSKVLSVEPVTVGSWTMYDIEVEDNHNFFANGILVHNSMETDEVYDKRKDALSEFGAVFRVSGMTDFTPYSPAGKTFYKLENQKFVLNYPQFVNPFFDEKEKQEKIEEYGGEDSIGYKVFVKGEVVEDGVSALDMKRIRDNCYLVNKKGSFLKEIKRFEISKESFRFWNRTIVVQRPDNADRIFVCADIGKKVTEIIIHSETADKYEYLYNIVLYNLTQQETETILRHVVKKVRANVVGIDCGDGEGRGIYSSFEQEFPKDNLVYYDGSMKIKVGFEYEDADENGEKRIKLDKGKPVFRFEYMSEFSVQRIKDLLYAGRCRIPQDYKFDAQFSVVIETMSGTRTIYKCVSTQGDHLFDAWRVFAIAQWLKKDFNETGEIFDDSNWGVGAVN